MRRGSRLVVTCWECSSDMLKDFDGELAIHFPGRDGLDKPSLLLYPKLKVCLKCGHAEFVVSDAQIEELEKGVFPSQWRKSASRQ